MADYTTAVRSICEVEAGLTESTAGYKNIRDVLDNSWDKIFYSDTDEDTGEYLDGVFPIFDESYREPLCKKILAHYYTKEIGLETVGLWKFKLNQKMCEIMPYYNRLYLTTLYDFNPLYDVDMTTTHSGTKTGDSVAVKSNQDSITKRGMNVGTQYDTEVQNSAVSGASSRSDENDVNSNEYSMRDFATTGTSESSNEYVEGTETSANKAKLDMYSDTPQGALTGVESGTYLTNARKITDTEIGSSQTTGVGDTTQTTSGKDKETNENLRGEKSTRNISDSNSTSEQGSKVGSHINNLETENVDSGSSNGTSVERINNTEDYVLHVAGKTAGASYSKLIKEFRDTLLNIDMEIIKDLNDLFMLVW